MPFLKPQAGMTAQPISWQPVEPDNAAVLITSPAELP